MRFRIVTVVCKQEDIENHWIDKGKDVATAPSAALAANGTISAMQTRYHLIGLVSQMWNWAPEHVQIDTRFKIQQYENTALNSSLISPFATLFILDARIITYRLNSSMYNSISWNHLLNFRSYIVCHIENVAIFSIQFLNVSWQLLQTFCLFSIQHSYGKMANILTPEYFVYHLCDPWNQLYGK